MILVAGLSPAWQQIMRFDALRPGEVNRAAEVHWCASGKVINVALALARLGARVEMLSTIGGATGDLIRTEVEAAGVTAHWVETIAPTRVCTTILDQRTGAVTELVENTASATPQELSASRAAYQQAVRGAHLVVLTGSLPSGAPETYYRDLLAMTPCPAILDFRGPELLAALEHRPLLVKPNREELARTFGRDLHDDDDLGAAAAELHARGAQWVAITDGGRPLFVSGPQTRFMVVPLELSVVNPIGSGDCLAAGIAWGVEAGLSMREAMQLGVAAAAENAVQLLPAQLDPQTVRRVAAKVRLEDV